MTRPNIEDYNTNGNMINPYGNYDYEKYSKDLEEYINSFNILENKKEESAFPEPFINDPHLSLSNTKGISKRFYAACFATQGILSNINRNSINYNHENIVRESYKIADELLKQENSD